jgi:hypothetical protein
VNEGRTPSSGILAYFAERRRARLDRQARHAEWDYLAAQMEPDEICQSVGFGWQPLVCELHDELLELDPFYRLVAIETKAGVLRLFTQFTPEIAAECERLVGAARYRAFVTCEVCGRDGRRRKRPTSARILCDDCFAADRAAASQRGERYADLALECFMSGDPEFPDPDALAAWLAKLES